MDFYVVEGEPVEQRRTVVEFEEDEDPDMEFEIIDYNGSPDYYSVLGIDRYSSSSEIKRAYRNLAYMYHPDKLQAAGIDHDGAALVLRQLGLAALYNQVFMIWLEDDDPGMARTMAASSTVRWIMKFSASCLT